MMGYALDDKPARLWLPGNPPPIPISLINKEVKIVGHNIAGFDYLVWNTIQNFPRIHVSDCIDTMAIAARFGLPQTLDQLGQVLSVKQQKAAVGKKLIKEFCIPPFRRPVGPKWEQFKAYCLQDVRTLREIHRSLPAKDLNEAERKIWQVSEHINSVGVPVDVPSLIKVYQGLNLARKYQLRVVPKLTEGAVNKITEVARIKRFCKQEGVDLPDLRAETVKQMLDKDLPFKVKQLLLLRQQHGRSSVQKYEGMLLRAYKGRVYDGLRYYGAATGRFSGQGVQWQNFPRDVPASYAIDDIINSFTMDYDVKRNPDAIIHAKSILRAMIKAPPGKCIFAGDYKSIEYAVLCWLCGETEAVERFRNGFDAYKDMASFLYNKPYAEITNDERRFGKTIVLGCGYVLGAKGLVSYAKGYGLDISDGEAMQAVDGYRRKYWRIKKAWYALYNRAVQTIRTGLPTASTRCKFKLIKDKHKRRWFVLTLPSGRNMYYLEPKVVVGKYDNLNIQHTGFVPNSGKKFGTVWLSPSRLIENIVQGLARDILCEHLIKLVDKGHKVITTIHDEVLIEYPSSRNPGPIIKILNSPPSWGMAIPVKTEYVIGERYGKG